MSHKSIVKIYPTTLRRGWDDEATCKGSNTDINDWIPDPYHVGLPTKDRFQLKANYCDQCKVAGECKQFGIETKSTGVFGGVFLSEGKLPRERL